MEPLSEKNIVERLRRLADEERREMWRRVYEDDVKDEPLTRAAKAGNADEVIRLLQDGVKPDDFDDGWTALMYASCEGHVKCVRALLEGGAQVDKQSIGDERTPLMLASQNGHVECVRALLKGGAQANMIDEDEETSLKKALSRGHVECVRALLEGGAQPNSIDRYGETSLMYATWRGHAESVRVLLEGGAQANLKNKNGDTALHIAAGKYQYNSIITEEGRATCVRALLSHPGIDINIRNNKGHTAMMDAGPMSLHVFSQMLKTCSDFPADSYGKVVLCGHLGSGKSTLTKIILNISKPRATRMVKRFFGQQDVVEPLTAGIIPHQLDSPYSNMIIYDLAGNHHFFSSHSACLEAISVDTPAIFLLLQDLRKDPEAITNELYYWSTMMDGVCHKCPQQSSVMVLGTHVDLLTPEQRTVKLTHLQSMAKLAISQQRLVQVVSLNLTKPYSTEIEQFIELLHEINKNLISACPLIPLHCHLMLGFLKQRLSPSTNAITLCDLLKQLDADPDQLARFTHVSGTISILKILSEKGLIVFIPNQDFLNSWIVPNKEIILKTVIGTIFADSSLQKNKHLVSNTGIVPKFVLQNAFPEYDVEMIMQLLVQFELCQIMNLFQVDTNMVPEGFSNSEHGPVLFLPAMVNVSRPADVTVPKNSFRWSLIVVSSPGQLKFFTTRCLHVLPLRLPIEFALLPLQPTTLLSPFSQACVVWNRGIKWVSKTGVTIIVEMDEAFQSLSLAMSSPDKKCPKYIELAKIVLAVIKKACEDFCPHVNVLEVITCPSEATNSDPSEDTKVELSILQQALLEERGKVIMDINHTKSVNIDDWLKVEPSLLCLIGGTPPASSTVPYSTSQLLSQSIVHVVTQLEETPTMPELLFFSDEKLNIAIEVGEKYLTFGTRLLKDTNGAIVKAMEIEHRGKAEQINMAILMQWLDGKGRKPVNWSTLVTVLQDMKM